MFFSLVDFHICKRIGFVSGRTTLDEKISREELTWILMLGLREVSGRKV